MYIPTFIYLYRFDFQFIIKAVLGQSISIQLLQIFQHFQRCSQYQNPPTDKGVVCCKLIGWSWLRATCPDYTLLRNWKRLLLLKVSRFQMMREWLTYYGLRVSIILPIIVILDVRASVCRYYLSAAVVLHNIDLFRLVMVYSKLLIYFP